MERGVSESDQRLIVDFHNKLRRSLASGEIAGQPKGHDFKEIKYDGALADAAQQVSDTCQFEHKILPDGRFSVGQNLYTSMSTNYQEGANWSEALNAWSKERNSYKYGQPFDSATGHYTQMIWANTEYIGCGYILYDGSGDFKYQKLYTCNYGPAGNYIGQNPYPT